MKRSAAITITAPEIITKTKENSKPVEKKLLNKDQLLAKGKAKNLKEKLLNPDQQPRRSKIFLHRRLDKNQDDQNAYNKATKKVDRSTAEIDKSTSPDQKRGRRDLPLHSIVIFEEFDKCYTTHYMRVPSSSLGERGPRDAPHSDSYYYYESDSGVSITEHGSSRNEFDEFIKEQEDLLFNGCLDENQELRASRREQFLNKNKTTLDHQFSLKKKKKVGSLSRLSTFSTRHFERHSIRKFPKVRCLRDIGSRGSGAGLVAQTSRR